MRPCDDVDLRRMRLSTGQITYRLDIHLDVGKTGNRVLQDARITSGQWKPDLLIHAASKRHDE